MRECRENRGESRGIMGGRRGNWRQGEYEGSRGKCGYWTHCPSPIHGASPVLNFIHMYIPEVRWVCSGGQWWVWSIWPVVSLGAAPYSHGPP